MTALILLGHGLECSCAYIACNLQVIMSGCMIASYCIVRIVSVCIGRLGGEVWGAKCNKHEKNLQPLHVMY